MPPLPGEERLLTTYADVHYYFSTPSILPRQHRFDKDSYLYVYHDPAHQTSRIEIANNPGTAELDAVCGSLQSVRLSNSDRFPTRCTLTVDGLGPPATQSDDSGEWRLTYIDPHDGGRAFLRVHTLDIYLWTLNDAKVFLITMQRLLSPGQLDIMPLSSREPSLSSVVQQLENVAVSDPSYRNSQMRTPGPDSVNVSPLPPPPPQPVGHQPPALSTDIPANQQRYRSSESVSPLEEEHRAPAASKPPETTQNFVPLGYNPAAPPAPEPVKHREKTPPPPDAATGTGLAAAAVHAHGPASFASPPGHGHVHAPEYAGQAHGSPGGVQYPYTSSAPYIGVSQHGHAPSQHQHVPVGGLSFAPPPTAPPASAPNPAAGRPGSMTFAPPPQDPNLHLYRQQTFPQQPMPGQYSSPQPSPAMVNPAQPALGAPYDGQQYPYGLHQQHQQQQQHQQPPSAHQYDIHSQLYRPTDTDNATDSHGNLITPAGHAVPPAGHTVAPGGQPVPAGGQKTGKITENAMRVEKGMNRFLKKLEKKF